MTRLAAILRSLASAPAEGGPPRGNGWPGTRALSLLAAASGFVPSAAAAHPGHETGLVSGLLHPLVGVDHLIAMFAVGLWGFTLSGRARLALPLAFVVAMVAGAALAPLQLLGSMAGAIEPLVLASVLILSAAVALAVRMPLLPAAALVAPFGFVHGAAHGVEGSGAGYLAGMILATAGLHALGFAFGAATGARLRCASGAAGVLAAVALGIAW